MFGFYTSTFGGDTFYNETVHNKRRKNMAIAMAQETGNNVRVYDENNRILFTIHGELHGYTSNTVTIKQGNILRMYDEKGCIKGTRHC